MARRPGRGRDARNAPPASALARRGVSWGDLPLVHVAGWNLRGALALERGRRARTGGRGPRGPPSPNAGVLVVSRPPHTRNRSAWLPTSVMSERLPPTART